MLNLPEDLIELYSNPWLQSLCVIIATFVSEDLALISTGVFIAEDKISLSLGLISLLIGLVLGDFGLYLLGRSRFAQWGLSYFNLNEKVDSIHTKMQKNLFWVLFMARCVPGLRLPTFFMSGLFKVQAFPFFLIILFLNSAWIALILPAAIEIQHRAQEYLGPLRFIAILILASSFLIAFYLTRRNKLH